MKNLNRNIVNDEKGALVIFFGFALFILIAILAFAFSWNDNFKQESQFQSHVRAASKASADALIMWQIQKVVDKANATLGKNKIDEFGNGEQTDILDVTAQILNPSINDVGEATDKIKTYVAKFINRASNMSDGGGSANDTGQFCVSQPEVADCPPNAAGWINCNKVSNITTAVTGERILRIAVGIPRRTDFKITNGLRVMDQPASSCNCGGPTPSGENCQVIVSERLITKGPATPVGGSSTGGSSSGSSTGGGTPPYVEISGSVPNVNVMFMFEASSAMRGNTGKTLGDGLTDIQNKVEGVFSFFGVKDYKSKINVGANVFGQQLACGGKNCCPARNGHENKPDINDKIGWSGCVYAPSTKIKADENIGQSNADQHRIYPFILQYHTMPSRNCANNATGKTFNNATWTFNVEDLPSAGQCKKRNGLRRITQCVCTDNAYKLMPENLSSYTDYTGAGCTRVCQKIGGTPPTKPSVPNAVLGNPNCTDGAWYTDTSCYTMQPFKKIHWYSSCPYKVTEEYVKDGGACQTCEQYGAPKDCDKCSLPNLTGADKVMCRIINSSPSLSFQARYIGPTPDGEETGIVFNSRPVDKADSEFAGKDMDNDLKGLTWEGTKQAWPWECDKLDGGNDSGQDPAKLPFSEPEGGMHKPPVVHSGDASKCVPNCTVAPLYKRVVFAPSAPECNIQKESGGKPSDMSKCDMPIGYYKIYAKLESGGAGRSLPESPEPPEYYIRPDKLKFQYSPIPLFSDGNIPGPKTKGNKSYTCGESPYIPSPNDSRAWANKCGSDSNGICPGETGNESGRPRSGAAAGNTALSDAYAEVEVHPLPTDENVYVSSVTVEDYRTQWKATGIYLDKFDKRTPGTCQGTSCGTDLGEVPAENGVLKLQNGGGWIPLGTMPNGKIIAGSNPNDQRVLFGGLACAEKGPNDPVSELPIEPGKFDEALNILKDKIAKPYTEGGYRIFGEGGHEPLAACHAMQCSANVLMNKLDEDEHAAGLFIPVISCPAYKCSGTKGGDEYLENSVFDGVETRWEGHGNAPSGGKPGQINGSSKRLENVSCSDTQIPSAASGDDPTKDFPIRACWRDVVKQMGSKVEVFPIIACPEKMGGGKLSAQQIGNLIKGMRDDGSSEYSNASSVSDSYCVLRMDPGTGGMYAPSADKCAAELAYHFLKLMGMGREVNQGR